MKLNVDAVQAMKGGTMPIDPRGTPMLKLNLVLRTTLIVPTGLDLILMKKRGDLHVYTVTKLLAKF